jgi:hypothetical protein
MADDNQGGTGTGAQGDGNDGQGDGQGGTGTGALGTGQGQQGGTGNDGQGTGTGQGTVDHEAEARKWKDLARKHETTAKANADAAKRLAALEDGQKTEAQKLQDTLAEREVELATLRTETARHKAGAEAKLDPSLWEFITASDPAEALEQAKRLVKATAAGGGQQSGQGGKGGKPADLGQGTRQTAQTGQSANDWIRNAANRQ